MGVGDLGNDGQISTVTAESGSGIPTTAGARGIALGDLWNDGQISIVTNNMNQTPSLLVNSVRTANHWVAFRMIGTKSNRDGIGAKIAVHAGGRNYVDEARSGSSYISQNDLRVHFGLGVATHIDYVEVRWPSGLVERFESVPADGIRTLTEGSGKSASPSMNK